MIITIKVKLSKKVWLEIGIGIETLLTGQLMIMTHLMVVFGAYGDWEIELFMNIFKLMKILMSWLKCSTLRIKQSMLQQQPESTKVIIFGGYVAHVEHPIV